MSDFDIDDIRRVCHHSFYDKCEHRNWHIDSETEVRKVHSGWVEGGSNLIPCGTHGNWITGIKDDECPGDNSDGIDHEYCNNQEFDNTQAAGHKFDSRGFYADIELERKVPERPVAGLIQGIGALSGMMENGIITQSEYDAMMDNLHRDYNRMRANIQASSQPQPGRRYVEFPIHTSRNSQGLIQRQTQAEVPYDPDFRLDYPSLIQSLDDENF
jgi:hypothetical protein